MEISVIIPTLNEEENIEKCLNSVLDQNFPREKYEIIVSDGYSSDNTIKISKKYADKVVATRKRGLWYGRNFGARFAKGRYFVFIDADTILDREYLSVIHSYFEKGYLGLSSCFRLSGDSLRIRFTEAACVLYYGFKSTIGQDHLFGCNVCVSRKGFELTNGFRDLTLEDTGMADDLRKYGQIKCINSLLVTTSSRRLDDLGVWPTFRYYIDLWLVQKMNAKNNKFKPYTMIKPKD